MQYFKFWIQIIIIQILTLANIDFSGFYSFIFKLNQVFSEEKGNPVEKFGKDEDELNGIEIDSIWNLEYLPSTVYIDYECWNLKIVFYGEELTRNINRKKGVL